MALQTINEKNFLLKNFFCVNVYCFDELEANASALVINYVCFICSVSVNSQTHRRHLVSQLEILTTYIFAFGCFYIMIVD